MKIRSNRRNAVGVLLCAGALFFTACGVSDSAGQDVQTAETEQSEMAGNGTEMKQEDKSETADGGEPDVSAEKEEAAADGGQDENVGGYAQNSFFNSPLTGL